MNTKPLDDLLTEMYEVASKSESDDTVTMVDCHSDGGDEVDGPVEQTNTRVNMSNKVLLQN